MSEICAHANNARVKPILRWAGGKTWLIKYLDQFIPQDINNYHEPFLGGGAVFHYLQPDGKSFLSDINADLIDTYSELRDNPDKLFDILNTFKNTKDDYYKIRGTSYKSRIERAARFIYLNKTCTIGLFWLKRKIQTKDV